MKEDIVSIITARVKEELMKGCLIPVEVSARHVHLSREHIDELFGQGYELKKKKDLSQPGQYQCEERVMLIGPKGVLNGVAVLGPPRRRTQVELTRTDAIALGISPPVRDSGDLEKSASLYIAAPKAINLVKAEESVIIAKRHLHMTGKDAERFKVADKQLVRVKVFGERPLIFEDVLVRVSDEYMLRMHLDFDEANASGVTEGTVCMIC
jgi:putative phosphotransacetylase